MGGNAQRVENFLQGELFDPNLLAMPTRSTPPSPTKPPTQPPSTTQQDPSERSSKTRRHGETLRLDLPQDPPVRIVKSKRRKRHIAAYRQSGEIVISVPFRTTRAEITALIPEMVARVIAGEEKSRKSEDELEDRAALLLRRHLPEFTLRPASINWRPMNERWGSCTTVDRTIRISERLQSAPDYVIDCVLFHELIHLEIPGHGEDFHTLLSRFPDLARAEAFLEGYEAGERGC
jgi:predicted metal-dependent hydrolase